MSVVPTSEIEGLTNAQRNIRNLSKSSLEIPEIDLNTLKLKDPSETNFAIFIDGDSIEQGITDNYSRQLLMTAFFLAKAVVACNMMPS